MRVVAYEPLLSPTALLHELPLCDAMATAVELSRAEVRAVLDGADDRLLVVAGPCSVHDPVAAIDYAARLAALGDEHALTHAGPPPRGTRSSASLTRGAPPW
jgi:3-deoxy-7-phosphoheptulonate synthase